MAEVAADVAPSRRCEVCGADISPVAPGGQCPRCLLSLASAADLGAPFSSEEFLDAGQPRRVGDYELIEEIARGGMGVVYRAWQLSIEREVAVKMILAGQLASPMLVARFRNEAAAAAKLDHPHIVPVYEIGEFETQHFFSMRFIPGKRNIAAWARALPAAARFQAIALAMSEVARAVAYAHERGVLHRDLKPSNILIDEADEPQVTDFGLAKLLDDPDALQLTVSSAILGSPSYMAPEQAEPRGREITTATDVYGLGAILYELLSGRPPFTGATPLIVARRVVEEAPRRLLDVPADLDTLCRHCLAKNPADRYASAAALAEDLERFARGQPIEAQPESTFAIISAWSRRHPAIATLTTALFVALLVGFIGVVWQWRRAEAGRTATDQANAQLRDTITHLEWRQIDELIERDYTPRAVVNLAARLRADPQSWQAASYAISIIEQHPFAVPVGPALVIPAGAPEPRAVLSADGRVVAFVEKARLLRGVDPATMRDAFPPLETAADLVSIAFSPDGALLAAGTVDGAITLWQMPGGQLISRTVTLASPLREFVFSADGSTLVVAGGGFVGSGAVADFRAGLAPFRMLATGFAPAHVRSSADGRSFVAWGAGRDGPLLSWGPPGSGAPYRLPVSGVLNAALDAPGRRLAVLVDNMHVQVWDLAERRLLSTIESELSPILQLRLTPDGERVVIGFRIGEVRVYSALSGLPTSRSMRQLYQTSALTLSANGTQVVTGAWDFRARLWDVASGEARCEPIRHRGVLHAVTLSADAGTLLTLAEENGAKIRYLQALRLRPRVEPAVFSPPGTTNLDAGQMSPDGRYIAFGAEYPRPTLNVFETATGRALLDRFQPVGQVYAAEFSPDSRRLFVVTNRGSCSAWSVPEMQPLWPTLQLPKGVQPATLSPDGRTFAIGGTDGVLRQLDTASGKITRELRHGALIKSVRFSPDGTRLTTGGVDALVHIWDPASGEKVATLRGHRDRILATSFSSDGARVASASYDSTARLWDAVTGAPLGEIMPHGGEVSYVAWSPDGRRVATAARDGTARIWDGLTGAPLIDPIARHDTVLNVNFHRDGRRLLTLDQSGFRFWDVQTGEAVSVQYPAPASGGIGVDSPSFRDSLTPDGQGVCVIHAQSAARLWRIADPPAPVPGWFPDFLDLIATGGMGQPGRDTIQPGAPLLAFIERARTFGDTDFYEAWVRRYLGLAPAG